MGRTEPSIGRPPAAFRKDVRAKKAKATINKVIPSLLPGNPRAQKGIDKARLVNPDIALWKAYEEETAKEKEQQSKDKKSARRKSKEMEGEQIGNSVKKESADQAKSSIDQKPDEQAKSVTLEEPKLPRISLRMVDTLTAARDLLEIELSSGDKVKVDLGNKFARVGILNMGSPLSPGGGSLNGANSQEESLCMRTTLYPSLKDEWYRIPELSAIYTPDVLVFRDEEAEDLDKKDRFYVDCITAAMIRGPEFHMDEEGIPRYSNRKDIEMVHRKIRMVMRICVQMKIKRIVLGAWGCGAHGNPVQHLAMTWRQVLRPIIENPKQNLSNAEKLKQKERWEQIEEIVFAIKDPNVADAFAAGFGEEELEFPDEDEEEEEDEVEGEVKYTDSALDQQQELRNKIEELEMRIRYRATDPKMKAGLEAVLKGLQKQLADS
ncbi:hypothetical protein ACHAPJ_007455 [Fusarium lateritium]